MAKPLPKKAKKQLKVLAKKEQTPPEIPSSELPFSITVYCSDFNLKMDEKALFFKLKNYKIIVICSYGNRPGIEIMEGDRLIVEFENRHIEIEGVENDKEIRFLISDRCGGNACRSQYSIFSILKEGGSFWNSWEGDPYKVNAYPVEKNKDKIIFKKPGALPGEESTVIYSKGKIIEDKEKRPSYQSAISIGLDHLEKYVGEFPQSVLEDEVFSVILSHELSQMGWPYLLNSLSENMAVGGGKVGIVEKRYLVGSGMAAHSGGDRTSGFIVDIKNNRYIVFEKEEESPQKYYTNFDDSDNCLKVIKRFFEDKEFKEADVTFLEKAKGKVLSS